MAVDAGRIAVPPDAVSLLHGLVSIPSPTGEEARATEWLAAQMRALGFKAGLDAAGNVVGVAGTGDREIMLLGHVDTVPGEIPVRIEGGILHGRGAVDAKGPLCAFVMAASKFVEREDVKIVVIGAVREEGDSGGARHVVESGAYRPEFIVIGEPSGTDGITIGYRGATRVLYRVAVENVHVGRGRGAADETIAFVARLRETLGAADEPRFDAPTVSVRNIESRSDGLEGSCEALLDIRTPPGFTRSRVEEALAKCATIGRPVVLEHEDPVLTDKNNALVRAFLTSIRAEGLTPRFVKKTGTSDMNLVAPHYGVPVVAYGPGDSGLDHTPREAIAAEDYVQSVQILGAVLDRLAKP